MFKINTLSHYLIVIVISLFLTSCGDKFETTSGYTPKKYSAEGLDQLLKSTIEDMVYVKGGDFYIGCIDGEEALEPQVPDYYKNNPKAKDEHQMFFFDMPLPCKPENKVSLDSYSIAKFETSYKEYDLFTQEAQLPFLKGEDFHPVVKLDKIDDRREGEKSANAGWHQANRYCEWLEKKTGLLFSLPTDAQWEYAARSRGRNLPFATDTGYWIRGKNYPIDGDEARELIAKSNKYPPNPLGVYYMSGMKAEWVKDWHDGNRFAIEARGHNPQGPQTGEKKILRGGGYRDSPQGHTVWSRYSQEPIWNEKWLQLRIAELQRDKKPIKYNSEDARGSHIGFRCVVNHPKPLVYKDLKAKN